MSIETKISETIHQISEKVRNFSEPQPVIANIPTKDENGNTKEVEAYIAITPQDKALPIPMDAIVRQDDEFAYVKAPPQIVPIPLALVVEQEDKGVLVKTPQGNVSIPPDQIAGRNDEMLFVKAPGKEMKVPLTAFASTNGDRPTSMPTWGALSGGLQGGYSTGFPAANPIFWSPTIAAGIFGGYLGAKQGEKTDSLAKGLETGSAAGAGTAVLSTALSIALLPVIGPAAALLPAILAGVFLGAKAVAKPEILEKIPFAKTLGKGFAKIKKYVVKMDEKTHHHLASIAAAGGIAVLLATQPALAIPILYSALAGGLAGGIGTYNGNRLSNVRDREYGGYLLGVIARPFVPVNPLLTGASSPLGTTQKSKKMQALAAFLPAFALGAASGMLVGPIVAVLSGIFSGAVSSAGTLAGPKLMQMIRNFNSKLSDKLTQKFDSGNHKKGKLERILKAGMGGALMYGLFGIPCAMILGPVGAFLPAAAGAIYYGAKGARAYSEYEKQEKALKS